MTPDIRLEFRVKVKAGSADHRRGVPAEELRRERRPRASPGVEHLRRLHRHAVRLHHGAAPVARRITGPYNATGLGDTPSRRRDLRLPPERQPATRRRARDRFSRPSFAGRSDAPPTDADLESLLRFYQQERSNSGKLRSRDRDGAAPDPGRSGIRLPLRAAAGRRLARRSRIASRDTELASRLSFFLWSSDPRR